MSLACAEPLANGANVRLQLAALASFIGTLRGRGRGVADYIP